MTNTYQWVQWNKHKKVYDLVLIGSIVLYLAAFMGVSLATRPPEHQISPPILLMRALATLAIILLHVILCIGPLARLTDLAAPLLYNRRHLGVAFFLVALAHAAIALFFYGSFGIKDAFSALLAGNTAFDSISGFPFEIMGFLALLILFVMAATSHDFWLKNLSPRVWKSLHMLVYVAYALVLLHVVFGAIQSERSLLYVALLFAGAATVTTLHVAAGLREQKKDTTGIDPDSDWVDAGSVDDLENDAGTIVCLRGRERVAVFKHDGKVSAMSNVCAHQGGPLGEGHIVDGCVTCPWHGYQYLPDKGQSPPPYTEKIPTYNVRLEGRRIMIDPNPNPPGTPVEPAVIAEGNP